MRRLLLLVPAVIVALLLPGFSGQARATANDFTIASFSADYYLGRTPEQHATLQVHERIAAEFPNFDQNHGILRAIPQTYRGHLLDVRVNNVTNAEGTPLQYSTYTDHDNLVLKIGDPKVFVHDAQTYHISYSLQNVITKYDDHDELYWDVNGDQWSQNFGRVESKLHVPAQFADRLQTGEQCFAGSYGGSNGQCSITRTTANGEVVITAQTNNLGANQTLTFVAAFSPGTFQEYRVPLKEKMLKWALMAGVFGLPPVATLLIMWRRWRKYGRDPKGKGTVVPEYVPPKDVTVLLANVLLKERVTPMAISAQIVDFAVRGHIVIHETKKARKLLPDSSSYELEYRSRPKNVASEELEVFAMVFGEMPEAGKRVALLSLSHKLHRKAAKLDKQVGEKSAHEGYFVIAPAKAAAKYATIGGVLVFIGFIGAFITRGWLLGVLAAGVIILLFSAAMVARTVKGVAMRDYLLGLKYYMQIAEAERLKLLQSPRGRYTEKVDTSDNTQIVKVYERLLPYAMLFGIEKEWAKQFAPLYTEPPEWYHGNVAFNAAVFAGAMHDFSIASNQSFTAPSSSSGSGMGGGGFAGGGGGGGGGGGW